MESDDQKRDRQSKALGAAFLAHQVSQLEKSVDTLAFSRDPRLYPTRGARGGRGGRAAGSGGGQPARSSQPRQVRVVDASALVHALPVLKRWVRDDSFQLVVPLSALSTLDLLKKAPNPLHDLARDATRFLETQLDISRQIHAAFSPRDADARTRVRPQAQGEELPWHDVERLFVVPDDWVVELPEGVELPPPYRRDGLPGADGDEVHEPEPLPLPTANDIPIHLRSTLQCILYFYLRVPPAPSSSSSSSTSSAPRPPAAVTYDSHLATPAPLAASLAKLLASTSTSTSSSSTTTSSPRKHRDDKPQPDYLALSSGDALAYYLATFFPSLGGGGGGGGNASVLEPIPRDEVERARDWWRAQAQARQQAQGKGQGEREGGGARGGRGGRGGGPRGGGGGGGGSGSGRGSRDGRGGAKGGAGAGGGVGTSGDAPKSLYVP
ncbi:hypothetical protein JCM8208_002453 [Rhodotorula glutinis]